jgi:hypothetical protein
MKPSVFLRRIAYAKGWIDLDQSRFMRHLNNPRMALRKWRAWWGV